MPDWKQSNDELAAATPSAALAMSGARVRAAMPWHSPTNAALYDSDGLLRPSRLSSLRAVILLSGSVGQSVLSAATQRSALDLPATPEQTILDLWRGHSLRLSRLARLERLPVRIITDRQAPMPTLAFGDVEMGLTAERDPLDLRGTGGVLRDLSNGYQQDDYLLVATAAQVLVDSLGELAASLEAAGGDVALLAHRDRTPGSLMLIRCGCLHEISDTGYVDMKEQALPLIAQHHKVIVHYAARSALPVRTLADYTRAIHVYQRLIRGECAIDDPFAEQWESAGSIIEPDASVDPTARLHDSVVLRGGRVERGAVLVRSVVCPGSAVRAGSTVVDQLIVKGKRSS